MDVTEKTRKFFTIQKFGDAGQTNGAKEKRADPDRGQTDIRRGREKNGKEKERRE